MNKNLSPFRLAFSFSCPVLLSTLVLACLDPDNPRRGVPSDAGQGLIDSQTDAKIADQPDGAGSPATVPTCLDRTNGEKQVMDLSVQERTDYCADLATCGADQLTKEELKKASCNFAASLAIGFMSADAGQGILETCKALVADCMAKPSKSGEPDAGACTDVVVACTSTVNESSKCLEEQTAALKQLAVTDICALIANGGSAPSPQPSSCTSIKKECLGQH